jgi:hypothetical protein
MLNGRRLALLALAAVLGAIIYATAAPASQQAGPSRAEFNAVKKRLAKVEKNSNAALVLLGTCLQTGVPASRFNGYVAVDTSNNPIITTAIDVDTGSAPQAYVLDIGKDCATAIAQTLHIQFRTAQLRPTAAMRVHH